MLGSARIARNNGQQSKNSLYLLYNLVAKDFKLRYRRSVLGVVWSMLYPLLMMIVMALIFDNVFKWNFDAYRFPVYLILGQTFFMVFQDGTNGALSSVLEAAPLVKKVHVEKIIFPTEKVLFALVNFLFSIFAIAAVLLFFGMVPSWKVLFTPILVIELVVFTLGVAYLVSALSVFFRDVMHLWGVLMSVWYYFTPLFWPYDVLKNFGVEWVYTIIQFNPMYHFVSCFRQMVTGIPLESDPSVSFELGVCAIFAVVTFAVGLFVFKKLEKKFILYV